MSDLETTYFNRILALEAERDKLELELIKRGAEVMECRKERDALKAEVAEYKTTMKPYTFLCPDCEAPITMKPKMDGKLHPSHPVYVCPKELQEEVNALNVQNQQLIDGLYATKAIAELKAERDSWRSHAERLAEAAREHANDVYTEADCFNYKRSFCKCKEAVTAFDAERKGRME